jgi:cyclohexanecarboxyl-CoA dehydrogenase
MNTNPNPYIDDDLKALADTARRFAEDRVKPGFLERDQTRVLDRDLMREMGELGFIGPELPEAFGGLGLGCLAAGVIHEEISRVDLNPGSGRSSPARPCVQLH